MSKYPRIVQTVLDATDVRALAEFYRQLLGLHYRPGDESASTLPDDAADWLVLRDERDVNVLAFQQVHRLHRTTWPDDTVSMQMHLDMSVTTRAELERQRQRVETLGGHVRLDRTDDPDEPLYVFTDPAGHPFCIFAHEQ